MGRHSRKSGGRKIKPTFFVFCEGESEDAYIRLLKSYYRVPIEISSKIAGNRITKKYIANTLKNQPKHEKDIIFLLYDIDAPKMFEKLSEIKNTKLLLSNPCFELWYILHFANQSTSIITKDCVEKFKRICPDYQKGFITLLLKHKLLENIDKAISKAKKLKLYQNPSTSVFLLIEELNKVNKLKKLVIK
jgi:hypothetical protein